MNTSPGSTVTLSKRLLVFFYVLCILIDVLIWYFTLPVPLEYIGQYDGMPRFSLRAYWFFSLCLVSYFHVIRFPNLVVLPERERKEFALFVTVIFTGTFFLTKILQYVYCIRFYQRAAAGYLSANRIIEAVIWGVVCWVLTRYFLERIYPKLSLAYFQYETRMKDNPQKLAKLLRGRKTVETIMQKYFD